MNLFDGHWLSYVVRYVHGGAMAVVLGGAVLLWSMTLYADDTSDELSGVLIRVAKRFELLFWLAIGMLVMTGVGNLGAIGRNLPALETPWGQWLALKLSGVLLFMALSLARTMLVARMSEAEPRMPTQRLLRWAYGGSSVMTLLILSFAVALAHGASGGT